MDPPDLLSNLNPGSVFNPNSKLFRCIGAEIDGVPTDFLWAEFDNSLLLAVTQFGKIGSLVTVEKCEFVAAALDTQLYDVDTRLGAGRIENQLVGRFIAERLKINKPLYLFSDLKDYGVETVRAVRDIFADIIKA